MQSGAIKWVKDYVEVLASKSITHGKSEDTFAPSDQVTRAQFTLLLSRPLDLPKQAYEGTFSDVTEKMNGLVLEIEAANRAGIVTGNKIPFTLVL
ncbi:S-layer homology domain-containing protein [Sporosarcina sp. BP05]|uniref:S-layer homology domain-containing protein n=1 Tax=Sporosarcina sp. BP05 TaxID=2758726 RepID=UPI001644A80C